MPDNDFLTLMKVQQNEQLIVHLNGMTHRIMADYPSAEVQSWTIQKTEAEAIISSGNSAALSMAPMITKVCLYHHGASDDTSRLVQVKAKAAAIIANATAWAEIAAFVNGLRARTQDEIEAATTTEEVFAIMNSMRLEAEAFRNAAGF